MKIAVIGALGLVGGKMRQVLEEEQITGEFYFFDVASNAGKPLKHNGQKFRVLELSEENLEKVRPDFALLAVPNPVSAVYAPIVASLGGVAIDNSSYFRMREDIPLIVPEVNSESLKKEAGQIIANPNCSTIQAVVALAPLDRAYGLKRVVFSTYQAVSGAGIAGISDLVRGIRGKKPLNFAHPIFNNLIPQIDVFQDNGYTKEENKLINETKKILGKPELNVTATAVRVPVFNCHSISVNAEFEKPLTPDDVRRVLAGAKGIKILDDMAGKLYPMPIHADEANDVYVGRIRMDESQANTINMFVVADNLRKGAATNAVQILKGLL